MIGLGSRKNALGIMLDGRDLRVAHLGWKRGKVTIFAVEQITLPLQLDTPKVLEVTTENMVTSAFGINPDAMTTNGLEADQAGDVSGMLVNFLGKYPLKTMQLAVNIPDNQVSFHQFKDDFGLKGKALRQRLQASIPIPPSDRPENAMLDVFKSPEGGLTGAVFGGSIPLVEHLMDLQSFLPHGSLRFSLIDTSETALVNLARATLDLTAEEGTVLVYIGREFSSIIVLKGDHPVSFVQAIHEGYESEKVCNTLFARILLEQEEADLPEIKRIVLAGEIGTTKANDFFTKQFPEVKVEPMAFDPLDISQLESEDTAVLPNFAIPIAMAWEALDRKNPRFLHLDLMPDSIRNFQKFFMIAWHGFAVLGLIFVLMVGLSYQSLVRWSAIDNLEYNIQQKQETLVSLQTDLARVGLLQDQIENLEANLRFVDSQIMDPDKWSRLFTKLAGDFTSVKRIWAERIESIPEGFRITGKSQFRIPVSRLAYLLPDADLKRSIRTVSEKGELTYEFETTASIPQPEVPPDSTTTENLPDTE